MVTGPVSVSFCTFSVLQCVPVEGSGDHVPVGKGERATSVKASFLKATTVGKIIVKEAILCDRDILDSALSVRCAWLPRSIVLGGVQFTHSLRMTIRNVALLNFVLPFLPPTAKFGHHNKLAFFGCCYRSPVDALRLVMSLGSTGLITLQIEHARFRVRVALALRL